MCKCKCPFHFSKGVPRALSFYIVAANSIPIVGFFRFFIPKKIKRKKWESNQVFQYVWAIKLPRVEVVIDFEKKMTQVRCKIHSEVRKKKKGTGS